MTQDGYGREGRLFIEHDAGLPVSIPADLGLPSDFPCTKSGYGGRHIYWIPGPEEIGCVLKDVDRFASRLKKVDGVKIEKLYVDD